MKCRLCDRPTTVGTGKLCFDCTKSLHRARARSAKVRKTSVSASPAAYGEGMAAMGGALALGPMSIPAQIPVSMTRLRRNSMFDRRSLEETPERSLSGNASMTHLIIAWPFGAHARAPPLEGGGGGGGGFGVPSPSVRDHGPMVEPSNARTCQ